MKKKFKSKNEKLFLSIIIPCFNEEEVIRETIKRLLKVSDNLKNTNVELIFIDDGSTDSTAKILKHYCKIKKQITLIKFSRNFGHQIAVSAGIDKAKGDAIVLIDADLQDPPELIPKMITKWQDGNDVVYGTRVKREGESFFKIKTAGWFYILLNKMSDIAIPHNTGDFRLMDKRVTEALRTMPERNKFLRGMISWTGFKQTSISYNRSKRFSGSTKYPFKKMLHFALDGIFSFSTKPLDFSVGLGLIMSLISFLGILYVLYMRIFTDIWVEGWTTLMIVMLFIGGIQLVTIGIMGQYIGRIYKEIQKRPLYIIDEIISSETKNSKQKIEI